MKRIYDFFGTTNKETMQKAGYRHITNCGHGMHILEDITTGDREVWAKNKNHASYGIIYKNTHLEFLNSLYTVEV